MSKRGGGKAPSFTARLLPRSVLSSAQNAEEARTAVLLRKEMRSWRQLQLEPSSLRRADDFESAPFIDGNGGHIPATLQRLVSTEYKQDPEQLYSELSNRLSELVDGVDRVRLDVDEQHRSLQFMMQDKHGTELPASTLSDGTMRFVALAVMERDPRAEGLMCLEEPENGIHPQRIDSMMRLLYLMATDVLATKDVSGPLRQIVVTTHSPVVAGRIRLDDLVFAKVAFTEAKGARVPRLILLGLFGTWRARHAKRVVALGPLLAYLHAATSPEDLSESGEPIVVTALGLQTSISFPESS